MKIKEKKIKKSKDKKEKVISKLKSIVNYKEDNNTSLGEEQKKLFKKMTETNETMYITGKAGTGKSFLLKHFADSVKKNTVIVAPTGISALNIGGQTIHSLFHLDFGVQDHEKGGHMASKVKFILNKLDILVIDEVSMVRVDILEMINKKM